jgi:hypothetical protein
MKLHVSVGGTDTSQLVADLQRVGWCPQVPPYEMSIDFEDLDDPLPLTEALARAQRQVIALWDDPPRKLDVGVGGVVQIEGVEIELAVSSALEVLAAMPFDMAVFGSPHGILWRYPDVGEPYRPPSVPGHMLFGWGAAFRGKGHDWMVSRHWLESGPWKLWRGPNDTSLIQFHGLDVDATTALEQAKPGHADLRAGYVQKDFLFKTELKGLFDKATKTMKVIVHGRTISDQELIEWCAIRRDGRDGFEPFAKVAYIFMQEPEAQANLARIWRYGHEVWTIRGGNEVRLDTEYKPPATTPAWAK